jgi:hypothetical protein
MQIRRVCIGQRSREDEGKSIAGEVESEPETEECGNREPREREIPADDVAAHAAEREQRGE